MGLGQVWFRVTLAKSITLNPNETREPITIDATSARHKMMCGSKPTESPTSDTALAVKSALTFASGPLRLSRRLAIWLFRLT